RPLSVQPGTRRRALVLRKVLARALRSDAPDRRADGHHRRGHPVARDLDAPRRAARAGRRKLMKSLRTYLALAALAGGLSTARNAAAAVFYSGESVSSVSATGVGALNTHLHSTSSLVWTATFDYGLTSA